MAFVRPPVLHGASGEVIDGGFPFHVNANTTGQLIATGPCLLETCVVGKSGSTDWAFTIYDSVNAAGATTATEVSVCDFNAGGTYPFNCVFENGIWIVVTGATPGDVTFIVVDPSKV